MAGPVDHDIDVCRWCGVSIEYFNEAWWQRGTCVTMCEVRPYDAASDMHEPIGDGEAAGVAHDLPRSLDRPDVERWLNA